MTLTVRFAFLTGLAIALFLGSTGPAAFATTNPWQAGGYYYGVGTTGMWITSNTPGYISGNPSGQTFVWQGTTTDSSWFVQEVLRMYSASLGWRVEFWSFDNHRNPIDKVFTNQYQPSGCSQQYIQYFQASNDIFSAIDSIKSVGCSSWVQSWTFNDGTYGSYMIFNAAILESYDFSCSDFSGGFTAQFTSAIEQLYGSSYANPTFSVYNSGVPSCWSISAGYRYATITWT